MSCESFPEDRAVSSKSSIEDVTYKSPSTFYPHSTLHVDLPVLPSYPLPTPTLSPASALTSVGRVRCSDYFIAIFIGICITTEVCIFSLYSPVIPFQLRKYGFEEELPTMVGYTASAYAAGLLIMSPFAAFLGKQFRCTRYLIATSLTMMLVAILTFFFVESFAGIVIGRFLEGVAASGIWTFGLAFLADNVDPAKAGTLSGLAIAGTSLGMILGWSLGGTLFSTLGVRGPGYLACILLTLDIVLCFAVQESQRLISQQQVKNTVPAYSQPETPAWQSVKLMLGNAKIMSAISISMWYGCLQGGLYSTALTIYLNSRYGLDASQTGYTFLAVSCPMLFFIPLAGYLTDRVGARVAAASCLSGFVICLSLLCIHIVPYAVIIGFLVCAGVATSFVNTPVVTYIGYVDRSSHSRIGTTVLYAMWNMMNASGFLFMPLLVGRILRTAGPVNGFKIVLALMIALAVLCLALILVFMKTVHPSQVPDDAQGKADIIEGDLEKKGISEGCSVSRLAQSKLV